MFGGSGNAARPGALGGLAAASGDGAGIVQVSPSSGGDSGVARALIEHGVPTVACGGEVYGRGVGC